MRRAAPDVDVVASLLEDTAAELILPRFRRLDPGDIERKQHPRDHYDVVTIVDRDVEARLTDALTRMVPGSIVLGEEAAYTRPDLLQAVNSNDALWLVDPIDGTRNFVAGDDAFGVMLAYVESGLARAAWILLPARNERYAAERGSGARFNGQPVRTTRRDHDAPPAGFLHTGYMPDELRDVVRRAGAERTVERPDLRCAAVEYTDVVRGARDFALYYRLLPWDHGAPALILSEAGGVVVHRDGSEYTPRSHDQITLAARDIATAELMREWLPARVGASGVRP